MIKMPLKTFTCLLVLIFFFLFLTACDTTSSDPLDMTHITPTDSNHINDTTPSDPSDVANTTSTTLSSDAAIEGTWRVYEEKMTSFDGELAVFKYPDEYGGQPYIQFIEGLFIYYEYDAYADTMYEDIPLPYTIDGNKIVFTEDSMTFSATFSITDDHLTLDFDKENVDIVYTKAVKVDDSVLE